MSDHLIAKGSPKRDGSTLLDVPGAKGSKSAPQSEERTDDATPARTIRPVMLTIDGSGGSILLTNGMGVASWISNSICS